MTKKNTTIRITDENRKRLRYFEGILGTQNQEKRVEANDAVTLVLDIAEEQNAQTHKNAS